LKRIHVPDEDFSLRMPCNYLHNKNCFYAAPIVQGWGRSEKLVETAMARLLVVARTIYGSETQYEDYLDAGSRGPWL
jgi:hypothetical protein